MTTSSNLRYDHHDITNLMEGSMDKFKDAIRNYIAGNILFDERYPYADDESFLEKGIIDSINIMELVMFIEEKYKIDVKDGEIIPENFDSITRMAEYIRSKVPENAIK